MSKKLCIMQMVDSLSIGGAERVSVNYANAISELEGCKSYHCTTREEGLLKEFLSKKVEAYFMKKKSLFDFRAHKSLIDYAKRNEIDIIHAHSTSFFTAFIIKLFTGSKIVWHDHYGNAEKLNERSIPGLKFISRYFSYVFSVNTILKNWANENLLIDNQKIEYIPNYADAKESDVIVNLPGKEGKRIISLANLRPQKDHITLLKAYLRFHKEYCDWSLLLVGRDWEDGYSESLQDFINENNLQNNVFILGGRSDTFDILKKCEIGVLSSVSEGLPIALLEYGLAALPVVCTDVGECATVLENGKVGKVVQAEDITSFYDALVELVCLGDKRKSLGNDFHIYVKKNYSKDSIVNRVLKVYKSL